jgi:hypothetical protein
LKRPCSRAIVAWAVASPVAKSSMMWGAVGALQAIDARGDGQRLARRHAVDRGRAVALGARRPVGLVGVKRVAGAGAVGDRRRGLGAGVARLLLDVGADDEAELLDRGGQPRGAHLQATASNEVLERLGDGAGALPPERGIAREGAEEDGAHVVGDAVARAIDDRHVGVADAQQDVELLAAAEERPQDQRLGQHDPDGEQIAALVEIATDDLLGRHVAELALELPGVRPTLDLRGARDAEVGQLHRAGAIDQHVARRYVPVHELERPALVVARVVRVVEGAEDREHHVQAHVERQLLALRRGRADDARAGGAVDVLHRHVELTVLLAEVEDLDDVRVAQARTHPRLVDEHRHEVRIARVLRQDSFDRNDLLEAVRPPTSSKVDLRHTARSDPPEQLVGTQPQGRRAGGDRHRSPELNMVAGGLRDR